MSAQREGGTGETTGLRFFWGQLRGAVREGRRFFREEL